MDFDVNNHQMLSAGAVAQQTMNQSRDWQPMTTAPRDGTVIEVRNTYGVAPTYALAKWTAERRAHGPDGMTSYTADNPSWLDVKSGGGGWISESHLQWRPYGGDVDSYVDPTGGAQNSPAYWRGAVAAKYGLPLDHFEAQTERNGRRNAQTDAFAPRRGFWAWLFGG